MNKNKINITFLALLCLFIIMTFSCQKEVETKTIDDNFPSVLPKNEFVKANQGILEFSSWEAVDQTSSLLIGKSEEQKLAWEDELGFRSLAGILYNANLSNEEMYQGYLDSGLSKEEVIEKINHGQLEKYSDYCKEMIEENVLAEKLTGEDEYLDILLVPTFNLRYLNKSGIVIVADTIYQYTINSIKKITDGDLTKISMLDGITETDLDNKISVQNIVPINNKYLKSNYDNQSLLTGETSENGVYKLETNLYLRKIIESTGSGYECTIRLFVTLRTYKHTWGSWTRKDYDVTGNGMYTWSFDAYSGGGYVSGYGARWYYGDWTESSYSYFNVREETFIEYRPYNEWIDGEIWTFDDQYHFQSLDKDDDVNCTLEYEYEVSTGDL